MSYGLIYTGSLTARDGQRKTVRLLKKNYTGEVFPVRLGTNLLRNYAGGQLDKFQTIVGSDLTLQLLAETNSAFWELITSDEQDIYVELLYGSTVQWSGYLLPDQFQQPRQANNYFLTFKAADRLASLQEIPFDNNGTPYTGRQTLLFWIREILLKTGLSLPIRSAVNIYATGMNSGTTDDPLNQAFIGAARFLDEDNQPMSCYDVLDAILTPFNACIRQADGYWDIYRPTEATAAITYRRLFNAAGTYVSTDTITAASIPTFGTANAETSGELWNEFRERALLDGATGIDSLSGLLTALTAFETVGNTFDASWYHAYEFYLRADTDAATGTDGSELAGVIRAFMTVPTTPWLDYPDIRDATILSVPAARRLTTTFERHVIGNLVPDGDFERSRWFNDSPNLLSRWTEINPISPINLVRVTTENNDQASYAAFLPGSSVLLSTTRCIEYNAGAVGVQAGVSMRLDFDVRPAGLLAPLNRLTQAVNVKVVIQCGSYYLSNLITGDNFWTTNAAHYWYQTILRPGWYNFSIVTPDLPEAGALKIRLFEAVSPAPWVVSGSYGFEYDNVTAFLLVNGDYEIPSVKRQATNTAAGTFVTLDSKLLIGDGQLAQNPGYITRTGDALTSTWFRRGVSETRSLLNLHQLDRMNAYGRRSNEFNVSLIAKRLECSWPVIIDGQTCTISDLEIDEYELIHNARLFEIPAIADVTITTSDIVSDLQGNARVTRTGVDNLTLDTIAERHSQLQGLADDDHTQYMHNTIARTVTAKHTVNQFTLSNPGTNSTDAVRADRTFSTTAPLTGGGDLTGNRTLALAIIATNLRVNAGSLDTIQDIAAASSPTFAGLTLSGLTASRLMASNGSKAAASVANLADWVAGTANRISVANDGDGSITLNAPQDIHSGATPTFAGLTITNNIEAGGFLQRGTFIEGLTGGSGWRIGFWNSESRAEVDALVVRGALTVRELIAFQLRSLQGNLMISPAQARVHSVTGTVGSETITIEDPDGNALNPFVADDVFVCQVFSPNNTNVVKRLFRRVVSVSGTDIVVGTVSGAPADVGVFEEGDSIIQIYNTSDATRRSSIYFTVSDSNNPRQSVYDGVSSYSEFLNITRERVRIGNLNGIGDYTARTFGFFAGDDAGRYITVDAANGFRILDGAAADKVLMRVNGSGLLIGDGTNYLEYNGTAFNFKANNINMDGSALKIKSVSTDQFIKLLNSTRQAVLIENAVTASYTPDTSAGASSTAGAAGADGFSFTSASVTPTGAGRFSVAVRAQLVYAGVDTHEFTVYVDGSTNGGSTWTNDIFGLAGFTDWKFAGSGNQSYDQTRFLGPDTYVDTSTYNRLRIRIVDTTAYAVSGNVTSAEGALTEYQPLAVMNYTGMGLYSAPGRFVRFENGMLSFSDSINAPGGRIPILVNGVVRYLEFVT